MSLTEALTRSAVVLAPIVELDARVERCGLDDVEIDLDGAGRVAGTQRGCDATIGELIERDDFARDVVEVHDFSLSD